MILGRLVWEDEDKGHWMGGGMEKYLGSGQGTKWSVEALVVVAEDVK